MTARLNRREALKTTAALGAGLWLGGPSAFAEGPNDTLNIACIGVGGRGAANLKGVSSQNIVALCDVDEKRAGKAFAKYRTVPRFHDFRAMFDKLEKKVDAVVVSTPDHAHFHPAMMALQRGKHLYCEKPMAHSVWEVRQMTKLAAKKNVATQLGVQRHTLQNVHRVVELIKSGAIGEVTEVHSWVGGSRGMPKVPTDHPDVPDHLKWDLWLGPAKKRPYHPTYCPYGWRFWWDFGTGETGNWGCHILDVPYWALDLTTPTRVEGSGPKVHPQTTPKSMTTKFQFPANGKRGAIALHWSHTAKLPAAVQAIVRKVRGFKPRGLNNAFIGSKGTLLCGFGNRTLIVDSKVVNPAAAKVKIANSPGFHREWINACKGGQPATCHFGYSGPLTETVLLGNVAYRAGGGFDWNAETLKATGNQKAMQYLKSYFRKGWEPPQA